MDHYSFEESNIREHSRTMSRGCTRITKPPNTPPRGTCLFVNLLIRLRVTDNKCMGFCLPVGRLGWVGRGGIRNLFPFFPMSFPLWLLVFGRVWAQLRGLLLRGR